MFIASIGLALFPPCQDALGQRSVFLHSAADKTHDITQIRCMGGATGVVAMIRSPV